MGEGVLVPFWASKDRGKREMWGGRKFEGAGGESGVAGLPDRYNLFSTNIFCGVALGENTSTAGNLPCD